MADNEAVEVTGLKPCPFCGGAAEIQLDRGRGAFGVGCKRCVACHTPSWSHDRDAIAAWNTREASGGEVERPIIGIENRTAQEVFDIMCDRFRIALSATPAAPECDCGKCLDCDARGYHADVAARATPDPSVDERAREKPVPYAHAPEGTKVTPCLGFEAGTLYVYQSGYGERDGDGYFIFNDDDLDWEQDQESGEDYRIAKVDNSDLLGLRDHLNRLFPPAALTAQAARVQRLEKALREERAVIARIRAALDYRDPPSQQEIDHMVASETGSLRKVAKKYGLTVGQVRGARRRAALAEAGEG